MSIATTALLAMFGAFGLRADAQMSGNVTMELFKVGETKGQRYLQTPTGEVLPIKGDQLAHDATAVAIYRDVNNNYWFINKQGQPTSIPPEKVQWAINEISTQRLAKESTGPQSGSYQSNGTNPSNGQAPVQQTTIIQQPSSGSGSSGMGMLGAGVAAAGGAMLGSMVGSAIDGNHYYGMPYGTPMYRDNHGGYYMNKGNKVYVNNSHTEPVVNQWKQQGDWDHRNEWNHASSTTSGINSTNNNWNNNKPNTDHNWNNGNKPNDNHNWNKPDQPISRGGRSHEGWGGFSGGGGRRRR